MQQQKRRSPRGDRGNKTTRKQIQQEDEEKTGDLGTTAYKAKDNSPVTDKEVGKKALNESDRLWCILRYRTRKQDFAQA